MASAYAIESVFSLIDRVSAPSSKIGRALDSLGIKSKTVSAALKRDFDKAAARLDKLGASIKKFGGYATAAGIGAVGVGVGIAARQFVEFDNAVTAATAKFKDLDVTSSTYQQSLDAIGKKAREVAAVTEYNAVDTAGALDKMAMAGLTSSQSMSLLMGTTNLATAAGMDLTTAVDIATDALGAFNMMKDAYGQPVSDNQLSANLNRLSDVMAKTTNMFNTDMGMMFEAIKKGAPTFSAAGQSLEDFSAAVGVLASSGIKGEEAGTQLRNVIQSLAAPSSSAETALKRLGIAVSDTKGNFRNIFDILGDFESAFGENVAREFKRQVSALESIDGVSMEDQMEALYDRFSVGMVGNTQKMADLNAIFGKRTVTSMLLMLAEGSAGLKKYSEDLQNATGAAENIAEAMRNSIKNKLAVLGSAATEMGFKFVEAFQGKGVSAIETLTGAIEKFDVTPLVNFASAAVDGIVKFAGAIAGAFKIAWQFRHVIMAIAAPIAAYNIALMGITAITGIYNKITAISRVIIGTVTGFQFAYGIVIEKNAAATASLAFVTKEARIATAVWGGVLKAVTAVHGGFLKVIDAVRKGTLLATAAQVAQTAATGIAAAAQWAFNAALTANPIGIVIVAIAALIAIIVLLAKNWDKITTAVTRAMVWLKAFFASLGKSISEALEPLMNWFKGIWSGVVNAFKTTWESAVIFFKNIWNSVLTLFNGIWEGIKGVVSNVAGWIAGVWQTVAGAFSAVWTRASGLFVSIWEGIKGVVSNVAGWIAGVWQTVAGAFSAAWTWVSDLFVSIWEGIKGTITKFIDWLWPVIDNIIAPFRAIGQAIGSVIDTVGGWFSTAAAAGNAALDEYDRVNAKTSAATTKSVETKLIPPTDMNALTSFYDSIPGFGIPGSPGFGSGSGGGGAAGKSKLHGVVDISGGAIPTYNEDGTYTAAGAVNEASPGESVITRTAIEIAAILQRIDAGVSLIGRSLPVSAQAELSSIAAPETATRMRPITPRINMGGDEGARDYVNPRDIAPITQADRAAYSFNERREIVIEVAAEKGTAARIVRAPRDVDIRLVASGGNA